MIYNFEKQYIYAINVDDEIFGFVKSEEDAQEFIQDLSISIEKMLRTERPLRSFYQERKGDNICIYSLKKGNLWNGRLKKVYTVKYYKVQKIKFGNDELFKISFDQRFQEEFIESECEQSEDEKSTFSEWSEEYEKSPVEDKVFVTEKKTVNPIIFPPVPRTLKYMLSDDE